MPRRRVIPLAVFAGALVCFALALRHGFVWDDWPFVVETAPYRSSLGGLLRWAFTSLSLGNYVPLTRLSYGLDEALWGRGPAGFIAGNLFWHAANAALFFALARRLLKLALPEAAESALDAGAAVAALSFAVHPLRVESVAWISERRDVLSGFFFLSTVSLYLSGRRRWSLACFALAALSKPSVVPLPAVLVILDYYPLRRRSKPSQLAGAALDKAPYFAIASLAAAAAVHAQVLAANFVEARPAFDRAGQALYGAAFYLAKTAWPWRLLPFYPMPSTGAFGRAAAAVVLLAGAWALLRRAGVGGRAQAALWAFYAAMILPVSGLFQNGSQLVAARYSYLSCLGWSAAFGAAYVAAAGAARKPRAKALVAAGFAACLAALFLVTQEQLAVWRDDRTLWTRVLERSPDCVEALVNLAALRRRDGDLEGALRLAERAVAASDASPLAGLGRLARSALADVLVRQGRLDDARVLLERRLSVDPSWSEGHALLGRVFEFEGRRGEASAAYERAARLDPVWAAALRTPR